MKRLSFILFLAMISLISCSPSKSVIKTSKSMDIYGPGVIQKPVVVDLDVTDQKVTGTIVVSSSSSYEAAKQLAINDAIEKSSSDVLVEPTFKVETEGTKMTVTVNGFPAKYKNFRSITPEDIELLKVGIVQKAEVVEANETNAKKGNGKAWIITGIAAIIIVMAQLF